MNVKAASLLACLVLSGSASAGLAEDMGTPEEQALCRPDYDRTCAQYGFDTDRIFKCMDDNVCKLSLGCQKVIFKHRPDLPRCTAARRPRRRKH